MQVVGHFGRTPIAQADKAQAMLDSILRIGELTVIYDYERPQDQPQPRLGLAVLTWGGISAREEDAGT